MFRSRIFWTNLTRYSRSQELLSAFNLAMSIIYTCRIHTTQNTKCMQYSTAGLNPPSGNLDSQWLMSYFPGELVRDLRRSCTNQFPIPPQNYLRMQLTTSRNIPRQRHPVIFIGQWITQYKEENRSAVGPLSRAMLLLRTRRH